MADASQADSLQAHSSQTQPSQTQPQKFVLIVQPILSQQSVIWQAALQSQSLAVICESPDVDLIRSFDHLKEVNAALPDLLIIDTRIQRFNAYMVCRWCGQHYPTLKILLVNGAQDEIIASERAWAIAQGAVDLLPRIPRAQMMSSATNCLKRVMQLLDQPNFDSRALVSALLKLSRSKQSAFSNGNPAGYHDSN